MGTALSIFNITSSINLGRETQAEGSSNVESSSSSSSVRMSMSVSTYVAKASADGGAAHPKAVPFSCFKVLCNFLSFGNGSLRSLRSVAFKL